MEKKKGARIRVGTAVFSLTFIALFVAIAGFLLVVFRPDNSVGMMLRRVFPFPIVVVDGSFISFGEVDGNRESIRRFYESQSSALSERGLRVDFETPDGKKRLLIREKDIVNKLVEDRIIISLARERGIRFSDDEVEKKLGETMQKEGGDRENLESRLKSLYGWELSDFREKIVLPSLYREALESSFMKERNTEGARTLIEKAATALRKGSSFEKAAEEFSEGGSKEKGGDLGWVDVESLVPELQNAASNQAIGETGSIIESTLGYHILWISERKMEGEKEMVRLRQIFTRKPSFPEWLAEEKQKKSVLIFSRRYLWNAEVGAVLFRDEDLRNFEQRALERSEGDPSLIF